MLPVKLSMHRRFLPALLLTAAAWACSPHLSFAQQTAAADTCKSTITGEVQTFELASKIFENSRAVRVFLPPGYSEPDNKDRRYPVLYMLDGQNLFDACTAFDHVHEWEIDETITRLVKEGKIEPLVVVGLDNAREKRAYEYLAWKDNLQNPAMADPAGNRLPEFFLKEVMPLIEQKYRIAKGPENTAIGGSSYGGVAALYVGIHAPLVFGKVLAESPVLWVGNGQILRDTVGLPVAPQKVFLGYGGKEWDISGGNEAVIKMIHTAETNLKNAIFRSAEVKVVIAPEAHHNEQAWAQRFPEAVTFLFPANPK
jgi:predicted alpha/beta superfamily hydrolase